LEQPRPVTAPGEHAALGDVVVVETATQIPGAYCGRLLAGLGATVVKVESARRPDIARVAGPFPGDVADPERSGWHRYLHAGKRSVALDPVDAAPLFDRLVARADVLIDDGLLGDPPAVRARYDALLAANPRLVVVAFSPYGLDGPKAAWASSELTELAAGGWLQGAAPGRPPLMPGTPCAHHAAGVFGAFGALAALTARRRSGRGQLVETRLTEAFLSMLTCPTSLYVMSGLDGYRTGDGYPYAVHRCLDGYIGVSILTQAHWAGLCSLMGDPDLVDHPRYAAGVNRADPTVAAELHERIARWAATQRATEAFERGQAIRVPVAIVPPPSEVLTSPQYAARDYWTDLVDDDPDTGLGRLRLPGHPFRFAGGGTVDPAPAPRRGAHTGEFR
jgi:crotonobetainyl-CoA:carnitine CoA-transferase CaiB-like acyl-CoA transferase